MNGLSLLLYISLLAQAPAPLGSTAPLGSASANSGSSGFNPNAAPLGSSASALGSALASPNASLGQSSSDATDDARSFGWQIKNNELEYLIQISPSSLPFMESPTNKQELMSKIPPALVGRVKRVVVTIGDEILPRTPLEEIDRLIPAFASLQSSKVRELENGTVQNVNNSGGNGFGDFSQSNSARTNPTTAPLGSSLSDQYRANPIPPTARSTTQSPLLDRFSSAANTTSGQNGRLLNSGFASNNSTQNPNYSRVADNRSSMTGMQAPLNDLQSRPNNDPPALGGSGYGQTYANGNNLAGSNNVDRWGNPTTDRWGNPISGNPSDSSMSGQFGVGSNQYAQGQYNSAYDSQLARQQGYPGSTTGYGDTYARNSNPFYDSQRTGSTYAGTGGLLPATGYLASNGDLPRAGFPSTSYSTQSTDRTQIDAQRALAASRTDTSRLGYDPYKPAENNYFFYVFFILSIAVNIWMIHLLRTLYLRYRNLLSSLRSQATSLG